MEKSVNTVEKHDWKKNPVRYAPLLGYVICQPCWDSEHTRGQKSGQSPRGASSCQKGDFQCPCGDMENRPRVKFTGEGQTSISMDDPLEIGTRS